MRNIQFARFKKGYLNLRVFICTDTFWVFLFLRIEILELSSIKITRV